MDIQELEKKTQLLSHDIKSAIARFKKETGRDPIVTIEEIPNGNRNYNDACIELKVHVKIGTDTQFIAN